MCLICGQIWPRYVQERNVIDIQKIFLRNFERPFYQNNSCIFLLFNFFPRRYVGLPMHQLAAQYYTKLFNAKLNIRCFIVVCLLCLLCCALAYPQFCVHSWHCCAAIIVCPSCIHYIYTESWIIINATLLLYNTTQI